MVPRTVRARLKFPSTELQNEDLLFEGSRQRRHLSNKIFYFECCFLFCYYSSMYIKYKQQKKYFGIHFFLECQRYRTPVSLQAGVLSQTFVIQPFKRRRHVRTDLHNSPKFLEWLLKDSWIQVCSHSLMNNKNQIHREW